MTVSPTPSGAAAAKAADAVVGDLISAALSGGDHARLTNAPAGAGKTGAVTRLVDALADAGAHVGVIAQTNAQAFDLVDRIAKLAPKRTVAFAPAGGVFLPGETEALDNVVVRDAKSLGNAPVIVATADKWAYLVPYVGGGFDAGVIDESYQMPSSKLLRIADTFATLDFLGDPGQLDPFSTVDDARWRGLAVNPVLNAVDALLANHGDSIPQRAIPVTRRLPASAAGVIREIFYPDLRFGPATVPGDRELVFKTPATGHSRLARDAWGLAASTGWAYVELPHRLAVQPDREIVSVIGDLVEQFFAGGPVVRDERHGRRTVELVQDRLAVGVSHRNQRAALQIELQRRGFPEVVVDTANRLQGREFDVVVVWHPLAGRQDATAFHLDAGRAAVLTTRHRHACVVVGRAGARQLLDDFPPPGEYDLGIAHQVEFDGWEAHARLIDHLESVRV
jgi:hypothetical protein